MRYSLELIVEHAVLPGVQYMLQLWLMVMFRLISVNLEELQLPLT